jgi:hydroxyacylglutathione hydrolase
VARETGMSIRFVFDTHVHADHRSSGRELARESGADYVLYKGAGAIYN